MGNPVIIGKQLNATHKPKVEWSILFVAAILVVLGAAFQLFLSRVDALSSDHFSSFLLYAPFGIAAFAFMYFFDYTRFARYSKRIYFVLLASVVIGSLLSDKINGGYLLVYYTTLLFIPVFAGVTYSFRSKGYLGLIYSGLYYAGAAFTTIVAPSFQSFALLTISCLIILTVAITRGFFSVKKRQGLALVYIPTLLLPSLLALFSSTISQRMERIISLLNPIHEYAGSGFLAYVVRQVLMASKPFEKAVFVSSFENMSIDRILPYWSSHLSLTYLIATWGYIPGLTFVGIMLFLIIRMYVTVIDQKNAFGLLVSLSVFLAITGQIALFLFSNLGVIFPLAAILPFISFGAKGFIVNMALLGLLLSVYRRTDLVYDRLPQN
jgi:cell division protein FtsW (lipid II flippase)